MQPVALTTFVQDSTHGHTDFGGEDEISESEVTGI